MTLAELFAWLAGTLSEGPVLAVAGAFLWGVASVLLSPCHLAGIPLIVGFIGGGAAGPSRRAFRLSVGFAAGMLVSIAVIGLATGFMGRMLGDTGLWGPAVVAVVLLLTGLNLMGLLPDPFRGGGAFARVRGQGTAAAFVLGLVFGLALGPCTFAYMAPVLGAAFGIAARSFGLAVALVLGYAAGHSAVIVGAGTFADAVQRYLDWNERSHGTTVVKRVCGFLVCAAGVHLLYTALRGLLS